MNTPETGTVEMGLSPYNFKILFEVNQSRSVAKGHDFESSRMNIRQKKL